MLQSAAVFNEGSASTLQRINGQGGGALSVGHWRGLCCPGHRRRLPSVGNWKNSLVSSHNNILVSFRVNIRKIYDEIIHVRFVDVGDDGVVACEQLKTLPPELTKLPKMGLPAQLYGKQKKDFAFLKR